MSSWKCDVGWGATPPDLVFRDVAALAFAPSGDLYVLTRKDTHVLVFDASGLFQRSFGNEVLSTRSHGITIDADGLVYVVDELVNDVKVFSAGGELLQTVGTGVPSDSGIDWALTDFTERTATIRRGAPPFNAPTALAIGPDGRRYVADGYGNARVHVFDREWELIDSWGEPGTGPGEFHVPHGITIDDEGRVYVADRENDRVQIFDLDGAFVDEWTHVHRPTDIAIHVDGSVFVSEFPAPVGFFSWRNGELDHPYTPRVSAFDRGGRVIDRFENTDRPGVPGSLAVPHALALDVHGGIYVGEVVASSAMYKQPDDHGADGPWTIAEDAPLLQRFVPDVIAS